MHGLCINSCKFKKIELVKHLFFTMLNCCLGKKFVLAWFFVN